MSERFIRRLVGISIAATISVSPVLVRTAAQQPVPNLPAPASLPAQDRREPPVRSTYVLGPDDQIIIQVSDVPEISGKSQRIDPDGDLRLPMVGRVRAAGLTLEKLEQELVTRLKVYIQEPDVSVSIADFRSQPVSVIGAVGSSGIHQLQGRKTLIEMLSLAGGVTAEAGPTVRVTRRREFGPIDVAGAMGDPTGEYSIVEIDVKALMEARTPERNIVIRPHDVISIPRADVVYVVGEVGKSGSVPLANGTSISVMEAVSFSGGVLRTAKSQNARVLRKVDGEERRQEIDIDLKAIMNGKADDIPLMAGDIVIVPDSPGRRITTRLLEAVLQVGLIVTSYGIR